MVTLASQLLWQETILCTSNYYLLFLYVIRFWDYSDLYTCLSLHTWIYLHPGDSYSMLNIKRQKLERISILQTSKPHSVSVHFSAQETHLSWGIQPADALPTIALICTTSGFVWDAGRRILKCSSSVTLH